MNNIIIAVLISCTTIIGTVFVLGYVLVQLLEAAFEQASLELDEEVDISIRREKLLAYINEEVEAPAHVKEELIETIEEIFEGDYFLEEE